jgi:hypothetical protein
LRVAHPSDDDCKQELARLKSNLPTEA